MATITGSKYSGTAVSLTGTTFVGSGISFNSGDFTRPRIVVLYDSSTQFKGMAHVRTFTNSTTLELETDFFFDPVDLSEVTIASGDIFHVSRDFVDSGSGAGLTVSGDRIDITSTLVFGSNTNQAAVCFYDEGKDIRSNSQITLSGGVVVFGHYTDTKNGVIQSPCSIHTAQGSGVFIRGSSQFSHFYMFGGSIKSNNAPVYVGAWSGGDSLSFVLDDVFCEPDLLTQSAGGPWTRSPERKVLRNVSGYSASNNAILVRWGDGVISGGNYRIAGTIPISIFGSDQGGTYALGAPTNERLIALELGVGTKPALWRSNGGVGQTITWTNVISANKKHSAGAGGVPNNNATGIFNFNDSFSNVINGTKVFVLQSDNTTVEDNTTVGADGLASLTLNYSTVVGQTETVAETNWTAGLYQYGFLLINIPISTSNFPTIGGDAINIAFSQIINQITDPNTTESDKAIVDAFVNIDTTPKLYDRANSFFYDNYSGESSLPISRTGDTALLGSRNLTIDSAASSVYDLDGSGNITIRTSNFTDTIDTTGTVTDNNSAGTRNYSVTNDLVLTQAGTYTIDGGSIGNVLNTSGGNVIINLVNGATASTTTPGTGANQVDIQNAVSIVITAQDVSGNPIQDARVLLQDSSNNVLINDLTNSSGQVSTVLNFTSNENVTGRVRKGSSSPLFKTVPINAIVTSGGLNTTVIMVSDE